MYADVTGSWRWRLIAANGRTVASSGESFASHANARAAASNFRAKCMQWSYETYADRAGLYRWRAKSANGQTVATSGESFSSQSNAAAAAVNVRDNGGAAAP